MSRVPTKIFLLLFGLIGGWASALYFVDDLGSAAASPNGNWRVWNIGSGASSNPYAVAHFLLSGQVPPAQSLFRIYSNSHDDEGNRLRSECVYLISSNNLPSRWWSLSDTPPQNEPKGARCLWRRRGRTHCRLGWRRAVLEFFRASLDR